MTYDFDAQFKQGSNGEQVLDAYFAQWYEIEPAAIEMQRQGIDRVFTRKDNGKQYRSSIRLTGLRAEPAMPS